MSDIRFDNNEKIDEQYLTLPRAETQKAVISPIPNNKEKTIQNLMAISTTNALVAQNDERPLGRRDPQTNVLTVLKYAAPQIRNDPQYMLAAIAKNHNAYEYASQALKNNNDFVIQAIKANPAVYSHLPLEKKLDPQFHQEYEKKLALKTQEKAIGDSNKILTTQQAVDKDFPWDMEKYKKALSENAQRVLQNPTSEVLVTTDRAYMGAAQAAASQNPSLQQQIEGAEQEYYLSETVQELALSTAQGRSRMHSGVDAFLQKMEEMNPELIPVYEQAQRDYWLRTPEKKKEQDLQKMTVSERIEEAERRLKEEVPMVKLAKEYARMEYRQRHPQVLRSQDDYNFDQEAKKTIEEAKKRVKDIDMREQSLAYLKQASIDYIYSLASDGLISMDDASLSIGMISSIPTISKASTTHAGLIYASVNDFDNADFQTPDEAMTARAAQIKEAIIDTDAKLDKAESEIYASRTRVQALSDIYFHSPEDRFMEPQWQSGPSKNKK